jgi:hypothetical protein
MPESSEGLDARHSALAPATVGGPGYYLDTKEAFDALFDAIEVERRRHPGDFVDG